MLNRKAAEAHWRWVQRGKSGEGALDVVGVDARGARLDGEKLDGARLTRVNLSQANISYTTIREGLLTACDFTQAQLSSVSLALATIEHCTFTAAQGALLDLEKATVADSVFDGAALDQSKWIDATCVRSSFRRATFGNARFDRARFDDCDFRDTTYRPVTSLPAISMAGTLFERCDFRGADLTDCVLTGAVFRYCKFGGVRGAPASTTGVIVVDADFSAEGDGSDPGETANLFKKLSRGPVDEQPLSRRAQRAVTFRATEDARHPFEATVDDEHWTLRINDFPGSPSLYSLLIGDEIVEELMAWPSSWTRPDQAGTSDDTHEGAEYQREQTHFEQTRGIPPSELVK